jgi:formylmethanofuran dehydrogenase subunit C
MNATTLRVKNAPAARLNGAKLLPSTLASLSSYELARIVLYGAGESIALDELFDITQSDAPAPLLIIEGDVHWLDRLGAQMNEGTLEVHGHAGDYAGMKMTGGVLNVHGNAGLFAACELQGGRITVSGNVGDFAAGALPGDMEGMSGGVLTVQGDAGPRLADRMRRGTVLVAGNVGDFAASRLIAGTVCIGAQVGAHLGYGMRRGTVLLLQTPSRIEPTFVEGGHGFDVFWRLFTRTLAREAAPFAQLVSAGDVLPRRYAGDIAVDGRGELLIVKT